MWGLQYDENLTNNPFLREILTNHDDILKRASQDDWIICIPREGSFDQAEISSELILDHILVPSTVPSQFFCTLSKKQLVIKDRRILTVDPNDAIRILFEETFYIDKLKYSVFCVEKPLFAHHLACDTPPPLDTLDACIDYLWTEDLNRIQKLCSSFTDQNPSFQTESLQSQRDLIGRLYSQCLQAVLKKRRFEGDLDNLKLAVETYMQSCLDRTLIRAVNTLTCFRDSALNKLIRNSSDLSLKDLNISSQFCDVITKAKLELGKINNHVTVLDKMNCLKLTFARLYDSTVCLTSDDVLQIFVFMILKLGINNWHSNLVFLTHFQFSSVDGSNETSFVLTTLEAGLEFIKSPQFARPPRPAVDPLFRAVQSDDLPRLARPLCHPLCACDACLRSVDTQNERGQTLLAFAALLGRAAVAESLLARGADVHARDSLGRTPLHHACLNGHQDVLLVLTSHDADVNVADHDANTPLHAACRNGHENCVKALFYAGKRLDPNVVNEHGETPLHLAVRYNHVDIARFLLENGASADIADGKNRLPVDLAQNFYAETLFRRFEPPRPRMREQSKKIDLVLKAIENDDLPLACFYLGFSNGRSKCHPLCNCDECEEVAADPGVAERVSVNAYNKDGFTPLHFAAKYGRVELLRLLLDSHALPNVKTHKTLQTPLHLACVYQRVRVVKELVECGNCEVDARDYKGNTPLYYACVKNDAKIVQILLDSGAHCEVRNYQGRTIMQEVQDKRLYGILHLLEDQNG